MFTKLYSFSFATTCEPAFPPMRARKSFSLTGVGAFKGVVVFPVAKIGKWK